MGEWSATTALDFASVHFCIKQRAIFRTALQCNAQSLQVDPSTVFTPMGMIGCLLCPCGGAGGFDLYNVRLITLCFPVETLFT